MELTHRFTVPASREVTWAAFNDIESVAGCFPGAVVTGVEGDHFTGTCKVKLGPIALTYAGSGTFLEKDEAAGRFVMEAKGKDKRGNGTAAATVTATMTESGPDATDVVVLTELAVTGKPAQFGRGVIQDVSDKLLGQFVSCLEQRLGGPPPGEVAPEAVAGAEAAPEAVTAETPIAAASAAALASSGDEAGGPTRPAAGPPTGPAAGAQAIHGWVGGRGGEAGGEPDDALDLGATVLPILVKTYWRQLLGALVVLLLLRRLLRRREE